MLSSAWKETGEKKQVMKTLTENCPKLQKKTHALFSFSFPRPPFLILVTKMYQGIETPAKEQL